MVIVKKLNATSPWFVYHSSMDATAPEDYHLVLNTTAARVNSVAGWYDTAPTSLYVTMGADNNDVNTYVMYAFADVKGYSKFGTYEGNTNVDGPFIYTGFRPSTVMIKSIDGVEAWKIYDTKRSPFNVTENSLNINDTAAQVSSTSIKIDILSNGFKVRTTSTEINQASILYAAFAEFPLVSSNSKAGVAR